ncbi:hypothetical protein AB833_12650 [Chromatiales bacterium (ex Bugula neritina AB1)]|nr:hypothetical protein AB833_12650 [Chromatiales bacterium (ex Bugula neritina AB1)]
MEIETPFNQYRAIVKPEWIDYNGHLNVGYYHIAFDNAVEAFFNWLGFTPEHRKQTSCSTFALESHLNFLREVTESDEIRFESRLLDHNNKRMHFYQEMYHVNEGYLAASHESIGAYIDMTKRRTTAIPTDISDRLTLVKAAHSTLTRPWQIGHVISIEK